MDFSGPDNKDAMNYRFHSIMFRHVVPGNSAFGMRPGVKDDSYIRPSSTSAIFHARRISRVRGNTVTSLSYARCSTRASIASRSQARQVS